MLYVDFPYVPKKPRIMLLEQAIAGSCWSRTIVPPNAKSCQQVAAHNPYYPSSKEGQVLETLLAMVPDVYFLFPQTPRCPRVAAQVGLKRRKKTFGTWVSNFSEYYFCSDPFYFINLGKDYFSLPNNAAPMSVGQEDKFDPKTLYKPQHRNERISFQ